MESIVVTYCCTSHDFNVDLQASITYAMMANRFRPFHWWPEPGLHAPKINISKTGFILIHLLHVHWYWQVLVWQYPDCDALPFALSTRHACNIFAVQFLPCTEDRLIVSGAMDNTVQLHHLDVDPTTAQKYSPKSSSEFCTILLFFSTFKQWIIIETQGSIVTVIKTCANLVRNIVCSVYNTCPCISLLYSGRGSWSAQNWARRRRSSSPHEVVSVEPSTTVYTCHTSRVKARNSVMRFPCYTDIA